MSWIRATPRHGMVFLMLSMVTWYYYSFSNFVHNYHFELPHEQSDLQESGNLGSFDDLKKEINKFSLYGLALPLLMVTLVALLLNTSTKSRVNARKGQSIDKKINSRGDINVKKWTIIWFLLPLLLVMCDGLRGSHGSQHEQTKGWKNLYIKICMSLKNPSGYAAAWALSLFLIPVTKHSPILDWFRVTPVQALAFHRVAGWISFWNAVLHGFLYLSFQMIILNPQHTRKWYQQLKILLVPNSWKCFNTQKPWDVFLGRQYNLNDTDGEVNSMHCRMALFNSTGMISVFAFTILAITSLPRIRRYSYALFYSTHIPAAWIMLITAIWHHPACALLLIPNIMYYLSFTIPVNINQTMDAKKQSKEPESSPLVEAKLIQGGSLELTFATRLSDRRRHENRFVRLSCPSVSPLSHPFSVFSRGDFCGDAGNNASSMETVSVLLRPTGPFTTRLTKLLFPDRYSSESRAVNGNTVQASRSSSHDVEHHTLDQQNILEAAILVAPSPPPLIQVDSYYAGSFDWVSKAMLSHDQILLVAGGVGIVPFLEFLPSLQQRIQTDTESFTCSDTATGAIDGSLVEALLASNAKYGPEQIHLHWYCREIGLASHVWNNYLHPHIQDTWENNPTCQGRLKVHLHLTSVSTRSGTPLSEGAHEVFDSAPNSGLVDKHTYTTDARPVRDARFTQSRYLALLFPGLIMLTGTILHWWWYEKFIVNEKWNLIIRSHSILFTVAFAMMMSIAVEHFIRSSESKVDLSQCTGIGDGLETLLSSQEDGTIFTPESSIAPAINNHSFLTVSAGRPSIDNVINCVLESDRPGVYSCGPNSLMESVKVAINRKRKHCAFYREDSEF